MHKRAICGALTGEVGEAVLQSPLKFWGREENNVFTVFIMRSIAPDKKKKHKREQMRNCNLHTADVTDEREALPCVMPLKA